MITRLSIWSWPWMRLLQRSFNDLFACFVIQPIDLYAWLPHQLTKENQKNPTLKLRNYLFLTGSSTWCDCHCLDWYGQLIKVSIARPFRGDSVTRVEPVWCWVALDDTRNNDFLDLQAISLIHLPLMGVENIHIKGYAGFTLNSLVGWYQWTKAVRKEA